MRVRLTDGTREIEISAPGNDAALLRQIENAAHRLLEAMPTGPAEQRSPFGFGRSLDDLDHVALDSSIERADQDDEPELDDDEDGRA